MFLAAHAAPPPIFWNGGAPPPPTEIDRPKIGDTIVVGILRAPKQTKESTRRDDHMFLLVGCGPYVSIVWLWTICFYCVAFGHMFLLCGARPYVSVMWRWAICFYCVYDHMFS